MEVRARFDGEKPSLQDLVNSGEFAEPVTQGECLAAMAFAFHLKKVREQLNVSLTELSSRSGIDKAAISRIENGVAVNPTIGTLERLARSLGKRLKIELEDNLSKGTR